MASKRGLKIIALEYNYMMTQSVINGWPVKCVTNPAEYMDYEDIPAPEAAQALCAGCPMLVLCREQALATRPEWGVMGGIAWFKRRQIQLGKPLPQIEKDLDFVELSEDFDRSWAISPLTDSDTCMVINTNPPEGSVVKEEMMTSSSSIRRSNAAVASRIIQSKTELKEIAA